MQNYRVTWKQNGQPKQSGVAYDKASAEHRKARLEQDTTVTDIEIVPEKPGV